MGKTERNTINVSYILLVILFIVSIVFIYIFRNQRIEISQLKQNVDTLPKRDSDKSATANLQDTVIDTLYRTKLRYIKEQQDSSLSAIKKENETKETTYINNFYINTKKEKGQVVKQKEYVYKDTPIYVYVTKPSPVYGGDKVNPNHEAFHPDNGLISNIKNFLKKKKRKNETKTDSLSNIP